MLRRLLLRRAPPRGAALGRCLSDVSDEAPATRPRSESAAAKVKRSDMGRIAVGIGEGHRMKAGVKTCMGCGVEVVGGLSGLATGSKAMEVTAATKKKKASFSDITDGGKMCSRCSALKKGDVWSAYDALRDVGPEVFKKQLEYIVQRRRFGLCVYVVDAADFEGSVVAGLRNLIKGIPIILAITKTDLLPRISDSDIKYLKHRFEQRCTKVQAVHALAFDPANNTYMNENLVSLGEDVLDILGGRDVFVVGAANVGKSTLVKNLSRLLSEFSLIGKGRNKKSIRRRQEVLVEKDTISNITASHLPGTTLQAIRIPCFGSPKHALWDTPGIIQETSLAYSVFPTHLMEPLARPSKIIIRDKLRALPGESILLEAAWTPVPRVCLARIDVLTIDGDQSTPMEFDPYCPEAIHVRIVKTSEAPEAAIFSEESIDLPNKVAKLFKVPEAVKFGKWKTAAPDETSDYSCTKPRPHTMP